MTLSLQHRLELTSAGYLCLYTSCRLVFTHLPTRNGWKVEVTHMLLLLPSLRTEKYLCGQALSDTKVKVFSDVLLSITVNDSQSADGRPLSESSF